MAFSLFQRRAMAVAHDCHNQVSLPRREAVETAKSTQHRVLHNIVRLAPPRVSSAARFIAASRCGIGQRFEAAAFLIHTGADRVP